MHGGRVTEPQQLAGGVANAGAVLREGDVVTRPAHGSSSLVHQHLLQVRARGLDAVPQPLGIAPDGRERLRYIHGDVPLSPYPAWARTDAALASVAGLLARYHQAAPVFDVPPGQDWNHELADPHGGTAATVVCHNDVCLENVVFRGGAAVALIDFDLAAPGRPVYDLACMARMCVPLEPAVDARVLGFDDHDPFRRLRVVLDGYGLPIAPDDLLAAVEQSMDRANAFVRARVERGEPGFVEMFTKRGGQARFDRRREWFARNRSRFLDVLRGP
jgi:hypothetical protein